MVKPHASKSRSPRKAPPRKKFYRPTKAQRKQMRAYARFIPAIAKFKENKKITQSQLGLITKAKRRLRYTDNLRPLTEKQAKKLKNKGLIVGHGIRAIRLRNTSPNAKIRIRKNGIIVTSNGRTWEYYPIGADIESIHEFGLKQLQRDNVRGIALWTTKGRADETFDFDAPFEAYLSSTAIKYIALSDFLIGLAVLLK